MTEPGGELPKQSLNQISTHWSKVGNPSHFVLRYGPAVRHYLDAIVKNSNDAEEVLQDFLLRVVKHGFDRATPDRGRFRFYVKAAVRNAAFTHLKRKRGREQSSDDLSRVPAPDAREPADDVWLSSWRSCILDRAWRALDLHERSSPGNLFHTTLRLAADHPNESSDALAARASSQRGQELKPDAFRKQLSRARRHFAKLIVTEVAETLETPTPERVEEELIEAGLMDYVKEFLPPDWRTQGTLPD
ncbi:hypothetical protein HY251_12505 [bacterium]|nr:hypothetical protein [bacterium]